MKCLADHPRAGFDDSKASQINNLTIMTHGLPASLNLGGGYFYNTDIPDFGQTVHGYVNRSKLRVQLYACNTARKPNTEEAWLDRRTNGVVYEHDPFVNGEGSFAQLLQVEMGPETTVFGHTTKGHLSINYAARCYGKMANGAVNGKHMFDVYFPQSFVAEQAQRLNQSEDTVRTSMFDYYKLQEPNTFAGDNSGRDTFMEPEKKGQSMRNGWLSRN